jgi:CheY-like chemotaxis protein/HPt (histidine-containing phosphotransfer) domain-containing protein
MESLLRDLSVILSASVGTKRIEVLLDVDPQVPDLPLVGDDMRLRQVLINLGGNAIKFTADGEVVVKVGVAERDADSVLIAFSVRDSGIGIAPEQQRRVFDGFSQAESSTTRRFGGTGLGLAISRRLVELMGGELHLDSEVGVGSDFHFQIRFPIGAVSADEAVPGAATSGLRVLIVDDNPSARVVLAAMAASLGWRADVVASGPAAIQCSTPREGEPFPYQVVFVDWQMPGMDGWETSQHLRRIAGGADAPVVVMVTAHGRDMLHQRSEAEQRMLNGFLVKPVTASMLFDAVADARLALAHPQLVRQRPTDGPRRLDGLNILVAEDNANNQQVVRELLSAEGARITIAADGRQAVAAVAQADPPFDAVLMDVQMPEMDGYAATAEIRGRLGKDRLPIIAMTANAMHSDREACLAAGMNDHVGKPFDLDVLVATLNRHTGRADVASGPQPVVDQAAPLPEDLTTGARAQGIEVDKALMRLGGRVEIYLGMLRRFGDDLPQLLAQASSEFQRGQRVDAGRTAHTIKGLAATLGIPALATQAGEIERHLARPDGDAADEARLFAELTRVVADLRVVLARLVERLSGLVAAGAPEAGATLVDRGALRGFFDELCRLLADSDLGALELRSRMPVIGDTLDTAKLEALDAALAALDFESALALSRSLADELEG